MAENDDFEAAVRNLLRMSPKPHKTVSQPDDDQSSDAESESRIERSKRRKPTRE